MKRRHFVQAGLALGAVGSFTGCASTSWSLPSRAKVVVVGGGYGGATAAKYVRMLSDYAIDVLLIEPNAAFVSCPMSNLVIGGTKSISDITSSYDKLGARHGVKVVRDRVASIDTGNKTVTLVSGPSIGYDKLVLSPGIDMMWDTVEGAETANTSGQILQAWKAGPNEPARWPATSRKQSRDQRF